MTTNKFQPAGKSKLIKGSVLNPESSGLCFVLNMVNMAGKVDGEQYKTFDKKWPKVKVEVKGQWANKTGFYKLGTVDTVAVQSDVWVVNMLCQDDKLQTDIKAVENCLKKVCDMAKFERASVHVPVLLTKTIPELVDLSKKYLLENGVNVYFYEGDK